MLPSCHTTIARVHSVQVMTTEQVSLSVHQQLVTSQAGLDTDTASKMYPPLPFNGLKADTHLTIPQRTEG